MLAAASLTDAFTDLGRQFEVAHPGVTVRFNFGGSSGLARQVTGGASGDLFASASSSTMQTVIAAGETAGSPVTFARNQLEIAVPPGNPAEVRNLADTASPRVKLAVCAAQVPCGAAASTAYATAGLRPHPVTEELDVKAVLTKVQVAEVDAGLVYRTDVRAARGKVGGVPFAEATSATTSYPIVVLEASGNPRAAAAFVDLVTGPHGRSVLAGEGFLPP